MFQTSFNNSLGSKDFSLTNFGGGLNSSALTPVGDSPGGTFGGGMPVYKEDQPGKSTGDKVVSVIDNLANAANEFKNNFESGKSKQQSANEAAAQTSVAKKTNSSNWMESAKTFLMQNKIVVAAAVVVLFLVAKK